MILIHNTGWNYLVPGTSTSSTGTDFTYVSVWSRSNTCGSSVAGVTLQDPNTSANLEQGSNQNMCSDAGTYPGVFSKWELHSKIYLRNTLSLGERFWTYKFRFQYFDYW